MGRLLGQLLEITGLFDMHLRPELVLLQKTMVAVEGVARRHRLRTTTCGPPPSRWSRRWIRRELGPQAMIRDAIDAIPRHPEGAGEDGAEPSGPQTVIVRETHAPAWLIVCVTVAICASAAALVLSLWPAIV